MRGIYEIVSISTTREDKSFTFQRYNGYMYTELNTRHKLLMRYVHMMCAIGNAEGDKQPRKFKVIKSFYIF